MSKLNANYIQTIRETAKNDLLDFVALLEDAVTKYEQSWTYRRHQAKPEKHPRVVNVEELREILDRTKKNPNPLATALAEEVVRYLNDRAKFEFFARLSPLRRKLQNAVKVYSNMKSLALIDEHLKLITISEGDDEGELIAVEDHTDTVSRDEENVELMRELQAQSDKLQQAHRVIEAREAEIADLIQANDELKSNHQDLQLRLQLAEAALASEQPDSSRSYEDSVVLRQNEKLRQLTQELTATKREVMQQQQVINEQQTLLQSLTAKFTRLFDLAPQLISYIKKQFVAKHDKHLHAITIEETMADISKDLTKAKTIEAPVNRRISFARQESAQSFKDILVTFETNASGNGSYAIKPAPAQPIKVERGAGLPVLIQGESHLNRSDYGPTPPTPVAAAEEQATTDEQDSFQLLQSRTVPPTPATPATPTRDAATTPSAAATPVNADARQVASPAPGETPPQSEQARMLKEKKQSLRRAPETKRVEQQNTPTRWLAASMAKIRPQIADSPKSMNTTNNDSF